MNHSVSVTNDEGSPADLPLTPPPFSWDRETKSTYYLRAMAGLTERHRKRCEPYRRVLDLLGYKSHEFAAEEDVPFLPIRLFKEYELASVEKREIVNILRSSGTTGQRVSSIYLDRPASANQTKVLTKIVSDFIGKKRLPMLIVDTRSALKDPGHFSARGAGILGFSVFGRDTTYALNDAMALDLEVVRRFLDKHRGEEVLLFGFTYMIWQYFRQELRRRGEYFDLSRALLIHGGGWKQLHARSVDDKTFKRELRDLCGLERIFNYYGMVEQTGSIFMECEHGRLHASNFSEVIIRHETDFSPCPVGRRGLVQLLSPLATSYPGHSILSEDLGEITGIDDCPCGRKGKTLKIIGRVAEAEIRGCGDTHAATNRKKHEKEETAVEYLVGGSDLRVRTDVPCSETCVDFLDGLSACLFADERTAAFPDVAAFAFWCRKAHIEKIRNRLPAGKRLGRGLVFHVAPSNVPVNFAFSFVFGLLSGNSNIVRVPTKPFPQTEIIRDAINAVLAGERYRSLRMGNALVRYEHDDVLTAEFSARAQGRITWGGDRTVENIRRFPIDVRGVEIVFSDRYSFCVFDAKKIRELTDKELQRLAERFYNDTYSMDQNACSSPHFVAWWPGDEKGKERFWNAVSDVTKKYTMPAIHAVDKYDAICRFAIERDDFGPVKRETGALCRIPLKRIPTDLDELRGRFGLFFEYDIADWDELAPAINSKYQTICYFGIDPEEIARRVVDRSLPGIDRIVPVGSALDIDVVWDGCDIIGTLSRIIDVR